LVLLIFTQARPSPLANSAKGEAGLPDVFPQLNSETVSCAETARAQIK
jgi:hypothetical protein